MVTFTFQSGKPPGSGAKSWVLLIVLQVRTLLLPPLQMPGLAHVAGSYNRMLPPHRQLPSLLLVRTYLASDATINTADSTAAPTVCSISSGSFFLYIKWVN